MNSPCVCFIIGCARSGTSVLGELVAAHPDVTYIWEAHWVWEQVGHGPNGSHRYTAGCYHAQVQVKWYRDNHSRRVGRWQENLGREEQRLITSLLAPTLRRLGYTVPPTVFADGMDSQPLEELKLDVKPRRAPSPG